MPASTPSWDLKFSTSESVADGDASCRTGQIFGIARRMSRTVDLVRVLRDQDVDAALWRRRGPGMLGQDGVNLPDLRASQWSRPTIRDSSTTARPSQSDRSRSQPCLMVSSGEESRALSLKVGGRCESPVRQRPEAAATGRVSGDSSVVVIIGAVHGSTRTASGHSPPGRDYHDGYLVARRPDIPRSFIQKCDA